MQELSIMIGLSGSHESEQAARLAWSIAKRLNCRVAAEHVIDANTASWLLNRYSKGLLENQRVAQSYSSVCQALQDIADALKEKYDSVFLDQSLTGSCSIDYGDPIHKLSRKAAHHDLVLIGHRKNESSHAHERIAVAHGLAKNCPAPLLIVQEKSKDWTRLVMLITEDHTNPQYLEACICLARLLKIKAEIICLATPEKEPDLETLRSHLKRSLTDIHETRIITGLIKGDFDNTNVQFWSSASWPIDIRVEPDTLLVVPTRRMGKQRVTILGEEVCRFLDHLSPPQVLIWPEEYESEAATSRLSGVLDSMSEKTA